MSEQGFARELDRQTLINEQRRALLLGWSLTAFFVARVLHQGAYGFRGDDLSKVANSAASSHACIGGNINEVRFRELQIARIHFTF
jgi:hypothetical protein